MPRHLTRECARRRWQRRDWACLFRASNSGGQKRNIGIVDSCYEGLDAKRVSANELCGISPILKTTSSESYNRKKLWRPEQGGMSERMWSGWLTCGPDVKLCAIGI
jgi:hypothetical protein